MNHKTAFTITVFILALALLAGCQTPASAPQQPGIANPASDRQKPINPEIP